MGKRLYSAWRPGGTGAHAAVHLIYELAQEELLREARLSFPDPALCVVDLRCTSPERVRERFYENSLPCETRRQSAVDLCQSTLLQVLQVLAQQVERESTVAGMSRCDVIPVAAALEGTPLEAVGVALSHSAAAVKVVMGSTAPTNIILGMGRAVSATHEIDSLLRGQSLSFLPTPAREALRRALWRWATVLQDAGRLLPDVDSPDWGTKFSQFVQTHLDGGATGHIWLPRAGS